MWRDVTATEPRVGEIVMLRFSDGTEERGFFVAERLNGHRPWCFEDGTWDSSKDRAPKWRPLEASP